MRALGLGLLLFFVSALSLSAQQNRALFSHKLSPNVIEATERNLDRVQTFWILTSDTVEFNKLFNRFPSRLRLLNNYSSIGLMVVRSNWNLIDSLLPSQLIRFVDMPRIPKEELAVGTIDNSVNQINFAHHRFPFFNGFGIVVSIKENRFDSTDIDFKGRYLPSTLASPQLTTHALIMASLIGGGANSFYSGKGVAWGSTLSSSNFANLLPEPNASYLQYNISVQNHSYGTGIENFYGVDAAAYDASVIANPKLLHVFSAGNSGNLASNAGPYNGISGLANLTGSFKMAKNVLTVGATDSFNNVSPLSSKGPAYDGRVKPELVAYGEEGSSGAAALVSGTALMLQHAYKQVFQKLPSSALIRGILVGTATDAGPEGPDYSYGFGILNANGAMRKLLEDHLLTDVDYIEDSIDAGGAKEYPLIFGGTAHKMKITLCWIDPPAAPNAAQAMVNDLDLELINTTTGETWLPWVLSRFPNKDSLLTPARRGKDNLNTIELISIVNPPPGNYIVRVKASPTTSPRQTFFIVPSIEQKDAFYWTHPSGTDKLFSNSSAILRWHNSFENLTGKLEYQLGNNNWRLIDSSVDLSKNYYRWSVPDSFVLAKLRMTVGATSFDSDSVTISNLLNPKIGFNCPDSFLMYWNKPKGVNTFAVYRLGARYLEEMKRVTDSFIVISKGNIPVLHYTVAPVVSTIYAAIKDETLNYNSQGVGCYIKDFLVNLDQSVATLLLNLGTLYQVKSIDVEELTGSHFQQLQSVNISGLQYSINDNKLVKGGNTYRIKLTLQSGRIIYSNPETVYYFGDSKYLVFPNPVKRDQRLTIHSAELDPSHIVLFNSQGQKVFEKQLRDPVEEIPLHSLQKGVYFYIIYKNNKKDFQGSVLIH